MPRAAQEARQGLLRALAEQVPDGDVDAREAVDVVSAEEAAHPHEVVEILVDHHRLARIAPDHDRAEHLVDDRLHGLGRNDAVGFAPTDLAAFRGEDRKSTRLNSSHANISYAVFCLKKK